MCWLNWNGTKSSYRPDTPPFSALLSFLLSFGTPRLGILSTPGTSEALLRLIPHPSRSVAAHCSPNTRFKVAKQLHKLGLDVPSLQYGRVNAEPPADT